MSLVLRRAPGQSIIIGENSDIKVTYYREENGIAHIGIEAPKSVPVNRSEVHEKMIMENPE